MHERSHRRDGEGTEEETGMIIPSQEADGGSTGKVWKSTRITENVVLKVSQASVYLEKCGKSGIGKNDCVYMLEMVY